MLHQAISIDCPQPISHQASIFAIKSIAQTKWIRMPASCHPSPQPFFVIEPGGGHCIEKSLGVESGGGFCPACPWMQRRPDGQQARCCLDFDLIRQTQLPKSPCSMPSQRTPHQQVRRLANDMVALCGDRAAGAGALLGRLAQPGWAHRPAARQPRPCLRPSARRPGPGAAASAPDSGRCRWRRRRPAQPHPRLPRRLASDLRLPHQPRWRSGPQWRQRRAAALAWRWIKGWMWGGRSPSGWSSAAWRRPCWPSAGRKAWNGPWFLAGSAGHRRPGQPQPLCGSMLRTPPRASWPDLSRPLARLAGLPR